MIDDIRKILILSFIFGLIAAGICGLGIAGFLIARSITENFGTIPAAIYVAFVFGAFAKFYTMLLDRA